MNTYFEKLRTSGNKIDADIKKLEKIWESPMLFISGYGENVGEASPYIETFLGTLKGIQVKVANAINKFTAFCR